MGVGAASMTIDAYSYSRN